MALSQADFYAYSRATGAPVPRDPEEQARMAPEVLEFRRSQLKSPESQQQQGFGLPQALGLGAAVAGLGAAGYGISRILRQKPAAVARESVIRPATVDIEAPVRRIAAEPAPQAAPTPVRSSALPEVRPSVAPPAPRITPRQPAEGFSPRQYAESTGALATRMPSRIVMQNPSIVRMSTSEDLTSIQNNLIAQTQDQLINAVESGEDQITGRFNQRLQQNEDLDRSQPIVALPDGVPADQTQVTISDPWGKPTFVPPQPVAETPAAKLLPPTVVSKRQEAQDFLTKERQQLSMLTPGRRERALAQDPAIAEAIELYASTGDPNALSRLSPSPSSPIQIQPVTQTEVGGERLPTGKFFQPTGQNEFTQDLLDKDIDLTNKISGLGAQKQQVEARLKEIDETEPMLRYAMAGEKGEGGYYTKMFNQLNFERQNLPKPESFDADINDALAERNFVRQRLESAENLGSTYRMLNRQEGVRPFFEQTAQGEIIPETLEIRSGRPTITTEPKSGGGRYFSAYDPDAGTMSTVGIYGIERQNFPRASETLEPTRVTQRELVEEALAKSSADPYGDVPIPPSISELTEQQLTPERKKSVLMSEAIRKAEQFRSGRNPRGGVLPDAITATRRQMAAIEAPEPEFLPEGRIKVQGVGYERQPNLPGVTAYEARQRTSPADVAANQLEQYMSKLQRGRSTPLTSAAVIQPKLF